MCTVYMKWGRGKERVYYQEPLLKATTAEEEKKNGRAKDHKSHRAARRTRMASWKLQISQQACEDMHQSQQLHGEYHMSACVLLPPPPPPVIDGTGETRSGGRLIHEFGLPFCSLFLGWRWLRVH